MKAGKLRHRIDIQQLAETQDTSGDTNASEVDDSKWSAFITRRASIDPLVGRENMQDGQETAIGTHWIVFRHGAGVSTKHRVFWEAEDRRFQIKSVQNIHELDQECRLLVEEILDVEDS